MVGAMRLPLVVLHVSAGIVAMLAGALAIASRKGSLRIPMKWSTDSDGSGAASEQAALVTVMISEAPHFSQEFCE
jgi:hypothetical protein